MRHLRFLLLAGLCLITTQLVGGFTFPTNSGGSIVGGGGGSATRVECFSSQQAAGIGAGDSGSPMMNYISTGTGMDWQASGADDATSMFASFPSGTWSLTSMYATVTAALAAGEDCLLTLNYAAVGAADTDVAAIAVGAGTTLGNDLGGACEFSALTADSTVDDVGDYCVQTISTTVPALAGWRIRISDEDGGGANTCTLLTSATICVVGTVN